MAEYGRRSWKIEEGDWVERRHRHSGPSLDLPPSIPAHHHDGSGFVRRGFQDHRPQTVAPAPPISAQETFPLDGQGYADDNDSQGGRWVTLMGVPRDACLEVREFIEAHYGPTKAMFVAPPASAAMAASSSSAAAAGFGGGGGVGFVNRHGMGDLTGSGGGQLQECYLCFESAIHAEQAVRAGELHFSLEAGTANTVAKERLASVFPEAAAAAGVELRKGSKQRHNRRMYRSEQQQQPNTFTGEQAGVEAEDVDDGIAGRLWVDVTVVWCPRQRILPLLEGAHRGGGAQQPKERRRGDGDDSPSRLSAMLLGDRSRSREDGEDDPATQPTTEFVRSPAVGPAMVDNTVTSANGGGSLGTGLNSSVMALFFAASTHANVWLALPRLLLLLAWTVGNILSWALLGRRPTGVRTTTTTTTTTTAAAAVPPLADDENPSPPTQPAAAAASLALSSSSSSRLSNSTASSSPSEYVALLHSHNNGNRHNRSRRHGSGNGRGPSRANPVAALWHSIIGLCDGDTTSAAGGVPSPSLSPVRLLSATFYSIFRSVAPTPSELDLVLWSWLRLRSPHVQRNYQILRHRLRRLARAFVAGRDTAVGVYGNLDEAFYKYEFDLSPKAFGWDGAFADFRLFDDDYYYYYGGGGSGGSSQPAGGWDERGGRHSMRGGESPYVDYDTTSSPARRDAAERWLAGPPPLRVLLTWRPASWLARYSVVSATLVVLAVLRLILLHNEGKGEYA